MSDTLPFDEKHMEHALSHLGAKIASATEKTVSAGKQVEEANRLLLDVQTEIAGLYERLDTLLPQRDGEGIE